MVVKPEASKTISKVSADTEIGTKTPIVIRQQIKGSPANVIVKSVASKSGPTLSTQRTISNSGELPHTVAPQKLQITNTTPTVQKIITSKRQLLANNTPKIAGSSSLQHLLSQGTQKFVINQPNSSNKIIIASSANNQIVAPNSTTVTSQSPIVQNASPSNQQILINQQAQKVIQQQQYVNSTNQQQQIIVHGQRIILNPGQCILTQQQQQPSQVGQYQRLFFINLRREQAVGGLIEEYSKFFKNTSILIFFIICYSTRKWKQNIFGSSTGTFPTDATG